MTSHPKASQAKKRRFVKRVAMAFAVGVAIVGGFAWKNSGTAGVSLPEIAVNWRGKGGKDDAIPPPDLAVNWRGRDGKDGEETPPDLAINWRGKDNGGGANGSIPPA